MNKWPEKLINLHRCQPLVGFVVLLFMGIVVGYRFQHRYLAVGAVALLVALGLYSLLVNRHSRLGGWLAVLLMFALGLAVAAGDRDGREREAALFAQLPKNVTVLCRVGAEVVVTPLKGKAAKHTFDVDSFKVHKGEVQLKRLPVSVAWFGGLEDGPRAGELWQLRGSGKVRKRRNGTLYLAFQSGEGRSKCVAGADGSSWRVRAELARRAAVKRVTIGIEDWGEIAALNQAMLLGRRHAMPAAMRRIFVESGTIHVFAISGLHIMLVAAVLALLVGALGVPQLWWVLYIGPPLIFYTVLTGSRPSAVRACMMALLYFMAPLIGRRPNGTAALAGTALILHVCRPWLIFDVGSVLSFAVMGGLVVFCGPFCRIGASLSRVHKIKEYARMLRTANAGVRARLFEWLAQFIGYLTNSLAVSLAAFLASLPLTACYFGRFTPGGLLANLVIGPCAFMIVVAGFLGVATSFVSSKLAICFNNAAGLFTWIMVKTAEATVALPFTSMRIVRWQTRTVWIWFGLLTLLGLWLHCRRVRSDGLAWLEEVGDRVKRGA